MKTIYSIALTGSLLLIFSGEIHAQGGSDLKTILELARTTDNVNYTDAFDRTLLMHASAKGYKNACRILIRRGADPNMQAIDGVIAAMYASYNGHTGIVKLLLEKGLNSDSQETDGTNALLINARDELAETIKSLFYNPLKADSLYT